MCVENQRQARESTFPGERSAERRRFTQQRDTREDALKKWEPLQKRSCKHQVVWGAGEAWRGGREEQTGGDERVQRRKRRLLRGTDYYNHHSHFDTRHSLDESVHKMNIKTKKRNTNKYHKEPSSLDLGSVWSLSLKSGRHSNGRQSGMFVKFYLRKIPGNDFYLFNLLIYLFCKIQITQFFVDFKNFQLFLISIII